MVAKLYADIIKNAVVTEEVDETILESEDLKEKFNECISEMITIPKQYVSYNTEMVPVFKNNFNYFIEFKDVTKYMKAQNLKDIVEAMQNIADANKISLSDMSLVIESKEYMKSVIETAIDQSKHGNTWLLESCQLSMKLINMLKREGINVVTTH